MLTTSPWQRIRVGAIILASVFVIAVMGYRFLGGYDWIGAIWMVVITISTVGHSERSSFGPGLQLLTIFVVLFGMTAAVYTFGGFFQLVLEGELDRIMGKRRMSNQLQQLSNHIIVCGYGRMGQHLVQDLDCHDHALVVIDKDPAKVEEALESGLLCVLGDATDEDLLETVRVRQAKALVTSLPSDADCVFITLTARDMNADLQIVSRAEQQSTEKKLRQAGANRVVMPTIVGAKQMVRMVTRPGTANLIDLVTESSFEDVELDEVEVVETSPLVGKQLREVSALQELQLLAVAIQRPKSDLIFSPRAEEILGVGDTVMLMGHPSDIQRFRKLS